MRIILLTGSELRHTFFRLSVANNPKIEVLTSFCESKKGNIEQVVYSDSQDSSKRQRHLDLRKKTEKLFFDSFVKSTVDKSNPRLIEKGAINYDDNVDYIIKLNPDLIIAYGCSIIRSELLKIFKGRFINIHLGLSPYYRGSGTNFWPFVNNELQFVGTTFMHIDKGVDTGQIIHQIRARFFKNDDIHKVGNRLIKDSVHTCILLILHFNDLTEQEQNVFPLGVRRYYKKRDFDENSLSLAYKNLDNNIILSYLSVKPSLDMEFPIIKNTKIELL